jgi:ADP-ribosylglycohydrolase
MRTDLKSAVFGSLLGCAVGDALGAPYEGTMGRIYSNKKGYGKGFWRVTNSLDFTDIKILSTSFAMFIMNRGSSPKPPCRRNFFFKPSYRLGIFS